MHTLQAYIGTCINITDYDNNGILFDM